MTTHILVVDDVPAMADQYAYDLRRLGGTGPSSPPAAKRPSISWVVSR